MTSERSVSGRLLRQVVRLYPREFRDRFGDELVATCGRRLHDARERGFAAVCGFWLGDGLRLLWDAFAERSAVRRASRPARRGRVARLESLFYDLKTATRSLRASRDFVGVASLTLALGIGAATSIVSVADQVLFRALPYPNPEELHLVELRFGDMTLESHSIQNFLDLEAAATTLTGLAGALDESPVLTGAGRDPARVTGMVVTSGYFELLGATPATGRPLKPADFEAGAPAVAVVSHVLSERYFGADADGLGRTLTVDGRPHVVIGVMGPGYRDPETLTFGEPPALWLPLRPTFESYENRQRLCAPRARPPRRGRRSGHRPR